MQQLELATNADVGEHALAQAIAEAARLNGRPMAMEVFSNLASKVLSDSSKYTRPSRATIRRALEGCGDDLAIAVAAPAQLNPFGVDIMTTLESFRGGHIPEAELRDAFALATKKHGLPEAQTAGILHKLLAQADPGREGSSSRLAILNALSDFDSELNSLIATKRKGSENTLLSRVMLQLENSQAGEVSVSELYDALSSTAAKPLDQKQLKSLADGLMNGHSRLPRSKIRTGLESSLEELTNLAERSSEEHKVVSEIM